jgi:murein DD-endopeptidase MepM/ murein hydrolase activator NlpD
LISSYVIALILPSITFDLSRIAADLQKYSASVPDFDRVFIVQNHTESVSVVLNFSDVISLVYLTGCLGFFGLLIYRLLRLFMIIRSSPIKKCARITLVYFEHIPSPFTFFNYLFINQSTEQQHNWDLMYRHERAHMAQLHSLDLLFAELMIIVLWFNPLVWMMRRRIAEIHEYQADETVLNSHIDIKKYQMTPFEHILAGTNLSLISAFSHNQLHRRIRMMYFHKKTKSTSFKLIILIPILVVTILINTLMAQDQTFKYPVDEGRISSNFGMRLHPIKKEMIHHNGIDIAAPRGTPVYSAADGIVLETGEKKAVGNFIIISHRNNWQSFYAQLDKIVVESNQKIKQGEVVGYVGNSGISTAPHLHFELHFEGVLVDPKTQMDFNELKQE